MQKKSDSVIVIIVGLIFFITGFCVMVFPGLVPLVKTIGYKTTTATVISVRTYTNSEGGQMAVPTYEYYVDGVRYEKEQSYSQSASISPLVGDTKAIRYNPNNPDELADDTWVKWLMVGVGLLFAGVGGTLVVVYILILKRYKKQERRAVDTELIGGN